MPCRHSNELTSAYQDAFRKMEAADPAALPAFAALLGKNSGDRLVGFHLRRLLSGTNAASIELD